LTREFDLSRLVSQAVRFLSDIEKGRVQTQAILGWICMDELTMRQFYS